MQILQIMHTGEIIQIMQTLIRFSRRFALPPASGRRTGLHLAPPAGELSGAKRLTERGAAADGETERGERPKNGPDGKGTNSDRVLRTKQGAVSGAALWFLQAPAVARRKNQLSARGAVRSEATD